MNWCKHVFMLSMKYALQLNKHLSIDIWVCYSDTFRNFEKFSKATVWIIIVGPLDEQHDEIMYNITAIRKWINRLLVVETADLKDSTIQTFKKAFGRVTTSEFVIIKGFSYNI